MAEQALKEFGSVFANESERRHFAEYLTGLLVAERKNVSRINAEFAVTTDQFCLNRWITEADWDVERLNQRRLQWLQRDSSTRYSAQGVIVIDNTLIDHAGELIEEVGWFWDHANQRVYRKRWTGTETFHRDGKQHLGMGDYQLRNDQGQTRHLYLVMLAHSLPVAQMEQGRASEWAKARLMTIGEACQAVLRETLGKTITWAIDRAILEDWSHEPRHTSLSCDFAKVQLRLGICQISTSFTPSEAPPTGISGFFGFQAFACALRAAYPSPDKSLRLRRHSARSHGDLILSGCKDGEGHKGLEITEQHQHDDLAGERRLERLQQQEDGGGELVLAVAPQGVHRPGVMAEEAGQGRDAVAVGQQQPQHQGSEQRLTIAGKLRFKGEQVGHGYLLEMWTLLKKMPYNPSGAKGVIMEERCGHTLYQPRVL